MIVFSFINDSLSGLLDRGLMKRCSVSVRRLSDKENSEEVRDQPKLIANDRQQRAEAADNYEVGQD